MNIQISRWNEISRQNMLQSCRISESWLELVAERDVTRVHCRWRLSSPPALHSYHAKTSVRQLFTPPSCSKASFWAGMNKPQDWKSLDLVGGT